ncbi:hypothetical protein, partial [Pyramidobacter porci]
MVESIRSDSGAPTGYSSLPFSEMVEYRSEPYVLKLRYSSLPFSEMVELPQQVAALRSVIAPFH